MSKLRDYMCSAFTRISKRGALNWVSTPVYLKILYYLHTGKKLSLTHPTTYNEKVQWLKAYDQKNIYNSLGDKYEVRQYVKEIIGEKYLIPLLGVWNCFDDIDFNSLPNQFVLKCTHDSGSIVICLDKDSFNFSAAKKFLNTKMQLNPYSWTRSWVCKNVTPRIIAEQYMVDESGYELKDYKFFCFDGNPKLMFTAMDRQKAGEEVKFDFFDMDYNHLDIINGHPLATIPPKKPDSFEEMVEVAKKLSHGFCHVRVDLYDINGKVYFGEMTMYHHSGLCNFEPDEWDNKLGAYLHLPSVTINNRPME